MSDLLEKLQLQLSSDSFLAIDIGSYGMKVLEVKRKGTNYFIKRAFTMPEMSKYFSGSDVFNINGIVDSLFQIMHLERIKSKKVILSFSGSKLQTKIINIPELPDKEIKTFIELEYQRQFPNSSKLTDTLDFMPVGALLEENSNQKQIFLLLALYPNLEGERLVKEFQNKKFSLDVIDVPLHALGNIGRLYQDSDSGDTVVFDIGYDSSQLVFLRERTIVFSRTIAFGSNSIIKALQAQEDLPQKDAEFIFQEVGLYAKEDIIKGEHTIFASEYNELVEGQLTSALNDAYRSFQYANSNFDFNNSNILLTGGFSSLPYSRELIQKILEIEVTTWNMENAEKLHLPNGTSIINQTDKTLTGEYATCIGMAIRGNFE